MGPRSENRGYEAAVGDCVHAGVQLQWVHGPRTVVMHKIDITPDQEWQLQWVHGPRTVVMSYQNSLITAKATASMGPRSENRGYGRTRRGRKPCGWRFNGSTVREPWLCSASANFTSDDVGGFNGSTVREPWLCARLDGIASDDRDGASMGPRSENRGYDLLPLFARRCPHLLQWVHGPRTVVMQFIHANGGAGKRSFNGSTVREPWLCRAALREGVRLVGASMGPRSENRGYDFLETLQER